jgi:hypothetical protein
MDRDLLKPLKGKEELKKIEHVLSENKVTTNYNTN